MIKNYKCPGCGASMVYDEGSHSMVCPYCEKRVPVSEIEQEREEEQDTSQQSHTATLDREEADSRDMKAYHCPNCGAQIVTDQNTAATFCSFCGSPTLIEDRLSGYYKPKELIPFQIDKEKAEQLFQEWTRKGALTPRGFSNSAAMEKLTGMYVPYWLYDYNVNIQMSAEGTRSRCEIRGDMEYIYTDHYRIFRDVTADYDRIPINASDKMPEDIMERVEPFDYHGMVSFDMPYLAGFQAERYSHTEDELSEHAKERAGQYARRETENTIMGYETVSVRNISENCRQGEIEYAMLPVWILNYEYKGKRYFLTLNGQTGRIIGKLPVSPLRTGGVFIGIAAILFIILTLIGGLL